MSELTEGSPAPNFEAPDQDGKTIRLSDFKGRFLALYFYPRDNTPGCTKQACSFRDAFETLTEKGIAVVGVSPDPIKRHQDFIVKFNLPFPLIADTDKAVLDAYGVWKKKSMYGKTFLGVERSCFLIAPDGTIQKIWRKVKPDKNVELVLKAVEAG